jgi:hypothetical protein
MWSDRYMGLGNDPDVDFFAAKGDATPQTDALPTLRELASASICKFFDVNAVLPWLSDNYWGGVARAEN